MDTVKALLGLGLLAAGVFFGSTAAAQAGLDVPDDAITLGLIAGGLAVLNEGVK